MKIMIYGWNVGMKKIALVHYLRTNCKMSLSEAKGAVDEILARRKMTVVVTSCGTLQEHLESLRALGAVARADGSE
jgi:ribosomal protein L7/L12